MHSYRSGPQRRRSRFTVTVEGRNGIERKVVLAYDAFEAHDYYSAQGYRVGRVTRGDYRKRERALTRSAAGGFTIDQAALRDACDLLGLTKPVKVRFNSRQGATAGNYRFRGTHHDIMVKSYHNAAQASSTLWHELTHALQAERAGGTTAAFTALVREQNRYPYRSRPIEREAREMSETMADVLLCR